MGPKGDKGDPGSKGDTGPRGERGKRGFEGSAVGYAYLNPALLPFPNAIDGERVSVTNVSRRLDEGGEGLIGQWCFHDLPFTVNAVMATAVSPGINSEAGLRDSDTIVTAKVTDGQAHGCPLGTQAVLGVLDVNFGPTDDSFTVWFED